MEQMTSLERAMTVMRGGVPDRVPVDLHNFMMTAQSSGRRFPEFFQQGRWMAEAQIAAWERFGHDVLLLENGTAALAESCGCRVEYLEDSAPVVVAPALECLADVRSLEVPDPYQAHPLPELLDATRRVAEAIGDRVCVMGRGDQGPFSLAAMLRGQAAFLKDLALGEELDHVHALLDFCRKVVTRYALAQVDQGAHCTSIGESPAGPDVISPAMYSAYAFPYGWQMAHDLRRAGIPLAYHICGDVTPIMGKMVEVGAAIIEVDQKTDPVVAKALAQGKVSLLGPVDPSVMAQGTPQEVEEHCRRAIEVLAPGGGFILGPGCALPPTTPAENIDAMIETARAYGQY